MLLLTLRLFFTFTVSRTAFESVFSGRMWGFLLLWQNLSGPQVSLQGVRTNYSLFSMKPIAAEGVLRRTSVVLVYYKDGRLNLPARTN
jgi:hypothetical protein